MHRSLARTMLNCYQKHTNLHVKQPLLTLGAHRFILFFDGCSERCIEPPRPFSEISSVPCSDVGLSAMAIMRDEL